MRRLADTAGLSVTTLYNLIGGRGEIVATLWDDGVDEMRSILERDVPLEDPIQWCRAIVTVSVEKIVHAEAIFRPLAELLHTDGFRNVVDNRDVSRQAAGLQSTGIRAAIDQGLLRDTLDPDELGKQIFHGWAGAFHLWSHGLLDEAGFENRALYGLYVALLGVASEGLRPQVEAELHKLESELSQPASKTSKTAKTRRKRA